MPRYLSTLRALSPQLVLLLTLRSPLANALEIGPLQVYSQGGQALVAEVWVNGSSLELSELSARAAAAELYAGAHLPYPSLAGQLRLVVERREQERAVLLLRTAEPVPEGKSTVLLDLRWPGGGVIRGYSFTMDAAQTVTPPQMELASATPRPPSAFVAKPLPEAPASAAPGAAPGSSPAGEYLTQSGDTLETIARRESIAGTSLAQRMAAIFSLNLRHFGGGHPDRLRSGASLRMPSVEEATRHGEEEAQAMLLQARGFDAERGKLARDVAAAPAAPESATRQAHGRIRAAVVDATAAPDANGRLYIAQEGQPRSRQGRVAQLEAQLANQAQHAAERDDRLRQLEDMVSQLNTLLALQREQLAAAHPTTTPDASAPGSAPIEQAQGLLAAMPPGAGSNIEDRRNLHTPWHRQPAVQQAVVTFALLSLAAMLYTLISERIETAKRRKRRAQRKQKRLNVN